MEFEMALRRTLLGCLLALLQGLAPAQPDESPAAFADEVEERTATAMFWGDWDEVERLYATARATSQRSKEGHQAVCRFAVGADRRYRQGTSQAHQDAKVAGTREWVRRRPDSPLAHAMHVDSLSSLAWFYRGSGFGNTVSDQRFVDFRAKLDEALAYAKANATVMGRDNYYVRPLLTVLVGLGFSTGQRLDMARQSLRRDIYDECILNRSIDSLTPKWGASPQQLEDWIRETMRGLPEAEALKRYARLYDIATGAEFEQSLFERTPARWPLMRDGLRELTREAPANRGWKNRLAYYACMVKDREVAVPALEAIEADPGFDHWGSDGQRTYQACKRWALQS